MNQAQLSDVQIANLTLLLTIRDSVRYDKPAACCRFGLDGQGLGFRRRKCWSFLGNGRRSFLLLAADDAVEQLLEETHAASLASR